MKASKKQPKDWAEIAAAKLVAEGGALAGKICGGCHIEAKHEIAKLLREAQQPWRDLVEHLLEMDVLTPGGSNEGWAKRLLAGERG